MPAFRRRRHRRYRRRVVRKPDSLAVYRVCKSLGTQRVNVRSNNVDADTTTLSWNTAAGPGTPSGRITILPNALPNWGTWSTIFRYFRLNWVRFRFRYDKFPPLSDFTGTSSTDWPALYLAPAYESATTSLTQVQMESWPGAWVTHFDPTHLSSQATTYKLYPKVLNEFTETDGGTEYAVPKKAPWLPVQFGASAKHYGLCFTLVDYAVCGAAAAFGQSQNLIAMDLEWNMSFKERTY